MDCHETREILEEYQRRALEPDRARAVEAHLAGCPACRAMLAREEAVAQLVQAVPRSPAPPALARQVRALGVRRRGVVAWLERPGWPPPRGDRRQRSSRSSAARFNRPATSWTR
jgi:anti-sigma factor RsiW